MMPWQEKMLGEFVSLQRGHDLPTDNRGVGRVPVVGSFGITGYHDVARAKGPGVTVGRSGASAGTVFFINEDYWPHNTCLFVTDFHGNNPRFAYYLLGTLNLPSHAAGSAQPSLNRNHISPLPIQVPEKPEQDRIVRVLSSLDDKIELNRRMNETLEALAQAIFKDWFVDFGPTRRKAEGATDPVAILGNLIPDKTQAQKTATLFPATLNDDGLPEGWSAKQIGSLIDAVGGSTPSTTDPSFWEPSEHWWATPKDLSSMSDLALFSTERRISNAGLEKITSGVLPSGTVLLSSRAPIGYLAIAQIPVSINQGFIALKPTKDFGSAYLYLWCKANMEQIVANANGSTFQEISKKNFRPISSPLPETFEVVRSFGEIAEPLFKRIVLAAKENRTLAETRDYLLPKLMSGQVRVRDAEKIIEGAGA